MTPTLTTALVSVCRFAFCATLAMLMANSAVAETTVEIPFEKFVLDNGLRVIVHEDHKAPVVAVAVWYHVGSKNEPEGKTGFAHLFEHLMFEGTENYDSEYTEPFEEAGTIQQNGTTWFDRTNYFQTVPTPALDMALWMESERMGHLLGAVTQEKLDQERAVVKNEKRQGDNQPYGTVGYRILEGLFPPGHPYRHDSIGSMADLDAASLEDVHAWFRQYYGAANAVLVLAGDITPEKARPLVEKYFGDIDPGPPLTRMKAWVPQRSTDTVEVMEDDVPHARVYINWAVPGRTQPQRAPLELAAAILGSGKNARLYQALMLDTQLAVDVSVDLQPHELASTFSIEVTLAPGVAIDTVVDIVDAELKAFFESGPREDELERAKTAYNAALVRSLEHVGGFGGKATILVSGELYDGRPDFYQTLTAWINDASSEEVRDTARQWLSSGRYRLDVLPRSPLVATPSQVDRSQGLPAVGELPGVTFPQVERAELKNGIEVIFARRDAVPLVNVTLAFDAGYAADAGGMPGTSAFTLAMLEESTANRTALEVEALAESLGAEIGTTANLDLSLVSLSALKQNLVESVELLAEVVRSPAFSQDELERLRQRWLAQIRSEQSQPFGIALRTLPPLLYGDEHAYGIPLTGSGTSEAIENLERDDLQAFYEQWIRPDNASLFVVGDTTLDEIQPILESAFGNWKAPRSDLPGKVLDTVALPQESRVFLADRPGAEQTLILMAHLAPPTGVADNMEVVVMNDALGGSYNARVNQTLRVEKNWSYGAYTWLPDAQGQRMWMMYAPVQTDSTADAMAEMLGLVQAYVGNEPATEAELQRSVRSNTNSLPGQYETSAAVMGALLENYQFNRPDDYVSTLKDRYLQLNLEGVQQSAIENLHPGRATWVVVGDRERIGAEVEALAREQGLGEVRLLDNAEE